MRSTGECFMHDTGMCRSYDFLRRAERVARTPLQRLILAITTAAYHASVETTGYCPSCLTAARIRGHWRGVKRLPASRIGDGSRRMLVAPRPLA